MTEQRSRFAMRIVAWLVGASSVVVAAAEPDRTSSPFSISGRHQRIVTVSDHQAQYVIEMGGSVDMDNTMTRHYERMDIAFQPNLSLEIANKGSTLVRNPRIVINDRRNWWTLESLLDEILAGARDDHEKALLIWDFVRKNRYHDRPLFVHDELHDPVKLLCVYGAGLCDDSASVGCSLLYHAGLNASKYAQNPKKRHLHGHVMCEAFLDDDYRFLDIDENVFYLDRENERIVSGDALARDHDLAKREHAYGPIFKGWRIGETAAALFGTDDGASFGAVSGHRIDMTLRPGERIIYSWDDVNKVASDGRFGLTGLRYFGNSQLVYSPLLERYGKDAFAARDIVVTRPKSHPVSLSGTSAESNVIYEMKGPYVVCGGRAEAEFNGAHADDRFVVSLSLDGHRWQEIWSGHGPGASQCQAELDPYLAVHQSPPKYRYFLRLSLVSSRPRSASLTDLTIATDVMAAPLSLPRLSLGTNRVVYTDSATPQGDERHEVAIVHRWQESANIRPPAAPRKPLFPRDESTVQATTFSFSWPASEGADRYHIQVSRRADMRLPYRPAFDVVVEQTMHGSPFAGMFSPDTDYFWRVRPRNKEGLWGSWSDVWSFRWEGPRVPLHVQYHRGPNGDLVISWLPNPRGPAVHHYEVYGSNERGFSISAGSYHVKGLGRRAGNLLTDTDSTQALVVSPDADRANMNCCFYRVVAVDEHGVKSGPSDYVELPHPYIYAPTAVVATVGKPLKVEVKTLVCLGDLQHRYASQSQQYWEREQYEFELLEAPEWLRLQSQTGVLTGTPQPGDVGSIDVRIVARRSYPHEVPVSAKRGQLFQKTGQRFQATHRHSFKIRVKS